MLATSHPPLTSFMTERPCELFHMDMVGRAHVCSTGGKWYVLVIVDDYSRYAWVFFLANNGETFDFCEGSNLEVEERETWRCCLSYS
jgi:transposase InsO family protein